ncbi:hypothetical protein RISK_006536 [Rhodopirellula islandica]|uniref:Uncharacterized protein n=1 Tax=Rhodopirellula islandica TaxID=595434 RepID=A0A0J1B3H5_RHOIS|nr:hypothetical protein RISK_006536 [Rhodopirellula islandica]
MASKQSRRNFTNLGLVLPSQVSSWVGVNPVNETRICAG